jgi:hypothetical protein
MASIIKADIWQSTAGVNQSTVLQVVQADDLDYRSFSAAADSNTDWVSATITRKLPTSKIMVIFSGGYANSNNSDTATRLYSNIDGYIGWGSNSAITRSVSSPGTDRGYAQTAGSGTYPIVASAFSYLYTPSTSALTFTLTVRLWSEASNTFYPNGDGWRGGGTQAHSVGAHLVLMEIGA